MRRSGMTAVTWFDASTNQRHSAFSIPHFTFYVLHSALYLSECVCCTREKPGCHVTGRRMGLVIFSVKIHVKLSHDSLFAVKIFIDFSEN